MHQLRDSGERWWQKPLADVAGAVIPAELAILRAVLGPGESGLWLNSRGTATGVYDLVRGADGKCRTARASLPREVSALLASLYTETGLPRGAPDLVIWDVRTWAARFVEVKCPHWDRLSPEQEAFLAAARARGVPVSVAGWEFAPPGSAA